MMVPPAAAQSKNTITLEELSQYKDQISKVVSLFLDTYGDLEFLEAAAENRVYSTIRDQDKDVRELQDTYNACSPERKQKIRDLFSNAVASLTEPELKLTPPSDNLLLSAAIEHEFNFDEVFGVPTYAEMQEWEKKMKFSHSRNPPKD